MHYTFGEKRGGYVMLDLDGGGGGGGGGGDKRGGDVVLMFYAWVEECEFNILVPILDSLTKKLLRLFWNN